MLYTGMQKPVRTRKTMIRVQNRHTSCTWMPTIYIGGQCHKSCLLMVSSARKEKSRFTEKFIQSDDDDSNKRYIPVVDVSYPKHLQKIHSDLSFLPERMKIDKMPETFV